MKTLQLNDNAIEIYDENNSLERKVVIPLSTSISRAEDYSGIPLTGSDKTISPVSINTINGLMLYADQRVSISLSDELVISAETIMLDGIDVSSLTLSRVHKELQRGVIDSVDVDDYNDETTLTDDDIEYKYSTLVGDEVTGNFAGFDCANFYISVANHTSVKITLSDLSDYAVDDEITGASVANCIEANFNSVVGTSMIEVAYEDDAFTIRSLISGRVHISLEGTAEINILNLGMAEATLTYGTEDYADKKIKFVSGDQKGGEYIIKSAEKNQIVIEEALDPAPAENDEYVIVDDDEDATVNLFLWEYE